MIVTVQTQGAARVTASRPRRTAGADGFHVPEADVGSVATLAAPTALGGLLALQEEPPDARDRQALATGMAVLGEMAMLQRDLLDGSESGASAERIERLLSGLGRAADPRLDSLLRQVGLRARIALLRQGR